MTRRLVAAAALALGLLGGCSMDGARHGPAPSNEAVMAVLGTVRALHHEADVFEGAGDFERATGAVRRILALDFPRNMAEAEDLRADAYGRLAELALRRAAPDEALALADTGLRGSPWARSARAPRLCPRTIIRRARSTPSRRVSRSPVSARARASSGAARRRASSASRP